MNKILTFSGWGQMPDALEAVAPGAEHVPYYGHSSIESLFESLQGTYVNCVVGWSLGAQIAIRAIEQGCLKADKLVLISPPYQFVSHHSLRAGMPREEFYAFEQAFAGNSEKVLRQFGLRVAKNDSEAKNIAGKLLDNFPSSPYWSYWLEELGKFSCRYVDFTNFPETTIIHGNRDAVVDVSQIGLFVPFLPGCHIEIIDNCSHAPHLHDMEKISKLIQG